LGKLPSKILFQSVKIDGVTAGHEGDEVTFSRGFVLLMGHTQPES
jgi:hypothetical protein